MPRGNKIVLIGYRCTGKTTIGRLLAKQLGVPFFDTDLMVEKSAGKTIRQLVDAAGWAIFRQKEKEAVGTLPFLEKSVVATGGGVLLDEANVTILRNEGIVIWLKADAATIGRRMQADAATAQQRPPLSCDSLQKEIDEMLTLRTPVYRSLADFSIDTAVEGHSECVACILSFLKERHDLSVKATLSCAAAKE